MTDYERLQHLMNELYLPEYLSTYELDEVTRDIQAVVQSIRDNYGLDG